MSINRQLFIAKISSYANEVEILHAFPVGTLLSDVIFVLLNEMYILFFNYNEHKTFYVS